MQLLSVLPASDHRLLDNVLGSLQVAVDQWQHETDQWPTVGRQPSTHLVTAARNCHESRYAPRPQPVQCRTAQLADNLPGIVRDSKDSDGPMLTFGRASWRNFIRAAKASYPTAS
jgi:hypothetical protein